MTPTSITFLSLPEMTPRTPLIKGIVFHRVKNCPPTLWKKQEPSLTRTTLGQLKLSKRSKQKIPVACTTEVKRMWPKEGPKEKGKVGEIDIL